ncbi:MAG: transglycosylase domain-containing protein, partial [Candidatus Bathyarchaeia archaeon]
MKKIIVIVFSVFLLFTVLLSTPYAIYYLVQKFPGKKISYDKLMEILSVESPVYYDDEKTLVGVFFQKEHRKYVPFEKIPRNFINALIAAEDKNFFKHKGYDPVAILRAVFLNIKDMRLSHGGSTITQQTAKNIFERQKKTFLAKLKELIYAFKLEAHYSKEQILELYANQFFVSGNGRGIGIASEYFFSKTPDQLDLVESAFIAGCVKGPNRYNPFIQKTPAEEARARQLANERKNYVIKNMAKLGMIDRNQYEEAIKRPVPFNQGKISFPMNTVMDYVRDHLNFENIQKALSEHGIDNISTSGVKIYTTLNRDIQKASLLALRKNLSLLETKLTGYERTVIQKRYSQIKVPVEGEMEEGEFCFGKVVSVKGGGSDPKIEVRLSNGATGIIDRDGLKAIANALAQYKEGQWAEGGSKHIQELINALRPNDLVYVYLRKYRMDRGEILLDLEQFPVVNGGIIVLHKGQIKGMVGGFTNFYFNRAVDARRQVGSVFKPLVYLAALQLGWNNLDLLLNKKNVFTFGNQIYIPKPDHESPYEKVSMAWAGVKSENVATVWLLYHLCDRLTMAQFRDLADRVGMGRGESESYEDYVKKIRDKFGILMNESVLKRMAFEEVKNDILPDLIFEGRIKEAEALEYLKYGEGFQQYIAKKIDEEKHLPAEEREDLEPLLWNYLRLSDMNKSMKEDYRILLEFITKGKGTWPKGFYRKTSEGKERIVYIPYSEKGDLIQITREEIKRRIADRGGEDVRRIFS